MAQEYRYPLTRVCLRGGTMTLPRTMIGLFPSEGEVIAVDTLSGTEHSLYMSHPRVVAGLGPLFKENGLEVNDELLVVQAGEGVFDITPIPRSASQAVVEEVEEVEEVEVLDNHSETDGGEAAAEEAQAEGEAAQVASVYAGSEESAGYDADTQADTDDEPEAEALADRGAQLHHADAYERALEAGAAESAASEIDAAEANDSHDHVLPAGSGLDPRTAVREAESALTELENERLQSTPRQGEPSQGTLWASGAADEAASTHEAAASDQAVHPPAAADVAYPASRIAGRGAAYEEEDDNEAALAAVALTSRVRRVFGALGYRIEPLATGVAYLHAEMGRRRYKVLVQTLRSGERLDWAGLLSRRRNSPANYLAVMGDGADLVRLGNPANLARATLWSWEALARLEELHSSVAVTPLDLESHFGRDGLFDQGLKRFEQSVAARIAERGAASEVLTRLGRLKAPTVFLLEELAQDVNLSRDAVLRILDRFAEAPMHLVAKVDNGEFLLRQPVDAALSSLASYAESLRQRLPSRRREVITGLDDEPHVAPLTGHLLDDTTEAGENAEPPSG